MSRLLPILAADLSSVRSSDYMPDVRVEIAFTSTFVTPAASRVWTDVSEYVELAQGIDIDFGRQDERSTADANQLTLTLDNTDGRFTALRSASPYYPNVKIGRPIRVSATTVTGVASIRFVGFIDQWPVEWDGTDAYAKATVTASSRMSRLGLTAKMKSIVEQEILATSPIAYWTLGDPSGATQATDSSGALGAQPLALVSGADMVMAFGSATGPGTDGLTVAEFSFIGGALNGDGLGLFRPSDLTFRTLRASFRTTSATGGHIVTTGVGETLGIDYAVGLWVDAAGLLRGPSVALAGPSVTDGRAHDAAVVYDGAVVRLYLDGVEVDTIASAAVGGGRLRAGVGFTGTMAHVAVYDTALTPAQVAAQAEAVLTGFAGDRTDERLLRILDYVGVASSEVDAETGVETMDYQKTGGQSALDVLRDVESTESGVLFDGADGDLKFHNRSHRYLTTAAATLDMVSQHVGADYAPRLDRSTLVNDVEVTNPTTDEKARAVSTASSDEYGIATNSATSVADSYPPLVEKGVWLIASYAEPRMRCPSLTVDVLAHVGLTPSAETLLGLTVGSLIQITNAPAQSDTTSPSYFVEGYTERIGPERYEITYNLSPTYPTLNTFILDDATRGVLDTSILAY